MARKKEKKNTETAQRDRITPVDIQKKEFRVAMRGYHEQDVDQFLDDVTEEVARLYAENKRLHEELEFLGTRKLDVGAAGEAEALMRRAQEEADRILAAARTRGSDLARRSTGSSPGSSPGSLGPFISREREFLQSLADLIQSHAEAVKEELRRARGVTPPEPDSGPSQAEPAPADAGGSGEAPQTSDADSDPPTQAWTGQDQPEERTAEPKIEGQDWTRYYTERDEEAGAGAASKMGPAGSADDILDLTEASHQDFAGTYSAGAVPLRTPPLDDQDAEDRSLRELFWGED